MSHSIARARLLEQFTCLGPDCPDTCCSGWDMRADARQIALYKEQAPELLATVDLAQGIMKRDVTQGDCAQLCHGLCRIQSSHGQDFLSDSCHFYPRIIQRVGDGQRMLAAISCPEYLRLVMTARDPFAFHEAIVERLPASRTDVLPATMPPADADALMQRCEAIAADETHSAEAALAALVELACSLDEPEAAPAAPAPTPADAYQLYYALELLKAFGIGLERPRLLQTLSTIAHALDCRFDPSTRELSTGQQANKAIHQLRARWQADAAAALAPTLRRWLQAQLQQMAFPFGGFTTIRPSERAAILVQRFATVKLALMCHVNPDATPPDEATTVRVIQSLARFMDHLADAELTLTIHRDMGWTSKARLMGLIKI